MLPLDLLNIIPDKLKRKALDTVVDCVADKSAGIFGFDFSNKIRTLHSDAEFRIKFEGALQRAAQRFIDEYDGDNKDLMLDIIKSEGLFKNRQVHNALITILKHPGIYLENTYHDIIDHFDTILIENKNQEQIKYILSSFLIYLAEEVWNIEEFRGVYSLMFQKITAEATRKQVSLQIAQLETSIGIRNALIKLTDTISDNYLLTTDSLAVAINSDDILSCDNDDANQYNYFETYKINLISDIHNNLILELYDRPQYEDICVTPLVYLKDSQVRNKPFEAVKLTRLSRSVILGEPGSGKTTALRKLGLDLLNQTPVSIVPIYISLASFSSDFMHGKISSFKEYLNEDVSLHGCPDIKTLTGETNAEIVLLLDGWDEITNDESLKEIKSFLASTHFKFIITSRPEAQRTLPFVERYEMYPLSYERMEEFIRLRIMETSTINKIMQWLLRHPTMMRLAENPLNLSIITIVFTEEDGNIGNLTRTNLYERAFDAIIRQHHREHSYNESQIFELEFILQNIAYQTMAKGGGRFFSIRELNKASIAYSNKPLSPELLNLIIGKLGIVRDRRSGRMEFFHLWYQEFLTGRHIIEASLDIVDEVSNNKLASSLPYIVGLLHSDEETYELMGKVTIHDPYNYCRAIPEGCFSDDQIEFLINRVLSYGEAHSPKIPVRVEMARAIAQSGLIAIPSLFRILNKKENSDYSRRAALEALVILPTDEKRLNDSLIELLDVQSLGLLWHVIEQVGERKVQKASKKLELYTKHSDPIVVGDSIWAICQIIGKEDVELSVPQTDALINCLISEDRHVQGHALRTLGRLRISSAIPKLKKHLEQQETGYRWIVPEAAQLIGGREAIEVLDLALNDKDPKVIAAGLQGLVEINDEVPNHTIHKIRQHMESTIWIPFLEQPLGSLARSTYQKVIQKNKMDTIPKIYLTRHCKTSWNLEHRLQGTMDLPLSTEGRAEAKELLSKIESLGINRIITSPYKRAYETAKIYADHLNVPLHTNPGFRELNHGSWEGKTFEELLSATQYEEWLADATIIKIPDSPESITMAQQRAIEALRDMALKYGNQTLLIVMHKHIRAILQCGLQEIDLHNFGKMISEDIEPKEVPPGQIERLCRVMFS